MKIPDYLKKGDTIGIICPAGAMPLQKIQTCIETLGKWGYAVKMGKTPGNQQDYFSASDENRLQDLQEMLDDMSIKAILCARGGYGVSRIIDEVNWVKFKKAPKWIIGFSDITVFHSYLNKRLKIASLHAPMANAFNDGGAEGPYVLSLQKALKGKKLSYRCEPNLLNKTGTASGELVGGNLCLLAHQVGSASDLDTKGKILFIEDIGEYLYNIDRMLVQLDRAGKLSGLAGLVVGGFADLKDTTTPFGKSLEELVINRIGAYDYPVCFGFPVSHETENYALKCGLMYQLKVGKQVVLKEM